MTTLRARPLVAVLIALMILLALSGVAYALGRAFGYIPGVGLVENNSGMRTLTQPVSATRDGVTLTVKQLLVYPDHVQMVYEVKGIAPENDSQSAADASTSPHSFCGGVSVGEYANMEGDPVLILPDGTRLERMGGYDNRYPENTYITMPVYLASVPAGVMDMTVAFKCIYGARLGAVPENWEMPLKLTFAPAGSVVGEPVLEVTPSITSSVSDNGVTVTLDRVVPQDGKYLFYISAVLDAAGPALSHTYPASAYLVDSTGQKVSMVDFRMPSVQEAGPSWELQPVSPLAYGPYKLVIEKIFAYYRSEDAIFEFDPGQNPQVGQTWQLDQTIHPGGVDVRVVSAKMVEKDLTNWGLSANTQGIEFTFEALDGATPINLDIMDNSPEHNTGGMVTPVNEIWEPAPQITIGLFYSNGIPADRIPVGVYRETVAIAGHWELQWSAPDQTGVDLLEPSIPSQPDASGITAELRRVVRLDGGYLFFVHMTTPGQRSDLHTIAPLNVSVIDSTGKKIKLNLDAPQMNVANQATLWQFSTHEEIAAGALKLLVEQASASYSSFIFDRLPSAPEALQRLIDENSLPFDAGADPQIGQTWTLNQEFELGGYKGIVTTVRAVAADPGLQPFPELRSDATLNKGYEFSIQSSDAAVQWNVRISINPGEGNLEYPDCIGGLDGGMGSTTTHTATCRELPRNQLLATIEEISVLLDHVWQLDWTLPTP